MIVRKANRLRPICEEAVKPPADPEASRTWQWRVAKAKRAGRDPCQCATRASYDINGVGMCLNHAGQAALEHLLNRP